MNPSSETPAANLCPTTRRLDFLRQDRIELHSFAAVFLVGSLSWGRFHSVNERGSKSSDIDLLIVVDDFTQLTADAFSKSEIGILKAASAGLPDCSSAEWEQIDIFNCKVIDTGFPCDVSLSFVRKRSFFRLMNAEAGEFTLWRQSPSTATAEHKDIFGNSHTLAIERYQACGGFVDRIEINPQGVVAFVPNHFQMMILPLQETIGHCEAEIAAIVCQMARRIHAEVRIDAPWQLHPRYQRIPESILRNWNEHLLRGPRTLQFGELGI